MTLNKIFDYLTLFPPVWNQTTISLILLIIQTHVLTHSIHSPVKS